MLLVVAFMIGLVWMVATLVVIGLCVSAARGDASSRLVMRRQVAGSRARPSHHLVSS